MIQDLKPLGAFIENSIRPILEELHWMFDYLKEHNIVLSKADFSDLISKLGRLYVISIVLDIIKVILCLTLIGAILWKIYP